MQDLIIGITSTLPFMTTGETRRILSCDGVIITCFGLELQSVRFRIKRHSFKALRRSVLKAKIFIFKRGLL